MASLANSCPRDEEFPADFKTAIFALGSKRILLYNCSDGQDLFPVIPSLLLETTFTKITTYIPMSVLALLNL